MLTDKVELRLISPESILLEENVDMVILPGENGDFGVLPRHSALIAHLRPGLVYVHNNQAITHQIFIAGGFANVQENGCTVLAEESHFLDDLNYEELTVELKNMHQKLKSLQTSAEKQDLLHSIDITRAKMELMRRITPLQAYKK